MNTDNGEFKVTVICLCAFAISVVAAVCFEKFLDSDRELVIRHVIDISPIAKKK